jgi:hypothetical protein
MNVIGLMVRMSRRIDNERSCCDSVCVIHPGKGPHVGQLRCACCGRHRGWLSHGAVSWITDQVRKHGVPAGPIDVPALEVAVIDFRRTVSALRTTKKDTHR